jgi:ankyrin repeat protein
MLSRSNPLAIFEAIEKNDLPTLQEELARSSPDEPCSRPGATPWPPLVLAAQRGSLECLAFLITRGAALDGRDLLGRDAISAAALRGHLGCLKALLGAGASSNLRDNLGATPAMLAARQGQIDCLELLADAGADLNAVDNEGWSPAAFAAWGGRIDALLFFAQRGVDLDAASVQGKRPIDHARAQAQFSCAALLEKLALDRAAAPPQDGARLGPRL